MYIYLSLACLFFAAQFVFQKLFGDRTRSGIDTALWMQAVSSVAAICAVLPTAAAQGLFPTATAFIYALLYALSGIVCGICSIFAMACGRVATVSVFMLAGGTVLPFLYGICLGGEQVGVGNWIGFCCILLSLLPPLFEKTEKGSTQGGLRFFLLSLVCFFTNGAVSVLSKMHQVSSAAVGEDTFLFWSCAVRLVLAVAILLTTAIFRYKKRESHAFFNAFYNIAREGDTSCKLFALLVAVSVGYALCNTLGNVFSLRCMTEMDASVQFPLLSAGVIALTALFGRIFFREKITPQALTGLLLSLVGFVFYMF